MTTAERKYEEMCNTPSDINAHLPTIRKYIKEGDVVVELGVRSIVSTWALLVNKPRLLISVDIVMPDEGKLMDVTEAAKELGTTFKFYQQDSTVIDLDSNIDVLFIDTLHLYSHLVKELHRHAHKTKKFIIFHDVLIPEIMACVQDFLYNTDWQIHDLNYSGSGLAVLSRV